jgi:hypothetical protein
VLLSPRNRVPASEDCPLVGISATTPWLHKLNPLEDPGWDDLVSSHPDHSFYHSSAWAEVLRSTYGHTPTYFAVRDESGLAALLPVMEVNSRLTGRRGVCLPFTDACPPLGVERALGRQLFQEVVAFAKARGWRYFECRGRGALFGSIPASVSFYTHTHDLAVGEPGLFRGLESSVRQAIRKGKRAGVAVEISSDSEAVLAFYALHCETRQRHGLPPQPLGFFLNIYRLVLSRGLGVVVLARYRGRPVAAALFFHSTQRADYKYAASSADLQHLRGNNLVMWEAVCWYARQGYHVLHLGRTSLAHPGLREFKNRWGTEEQKIDYFKYNLGRGDFVQDYDRVVGWYNKIFRWMPIPIARLVGRVAYRHLS